MLFVSILYANNLCPEHLCRKKPPAFVPHSLCLTVFLSPASFSRAYEQRLKRTIYGDVKIDVYFNGELCASSFIAERHHGNTYRMTEHIVRFSGRRIGRLLEKPWVIVPAGQLPDGTLRECKRSKGPYGGAKQRWRALAETLEAEANKTGRDQYGEYSMLGDYLSSLGKLEMPSELEEMQKAGGSKFGVIDVIVILGKGQKDDASHLQLTQPTAIRLMSKQRRVHTLFDRKVLKPSLNTPEDLPGDRSEKTGVDLSSNTLRKRYPAKSNADAEIMAQSLENFPPRPRAQTNISNIPGSKQDDSNTKRTVEHPLILAGFQPHLHSSRNHPSEYPSTVSKLTGSSPLENSEPGKSLAATLDKNASSLQVRKSRGRQSHWSSSFVPSTTASTTHKDQRRRFTQPVNTSASSHLPVPRRSMPGPDRRHATHGPSGPSGNRSKHAEVARKTYKGPSPSPPAHGRPAKPRATRMPYEMVMDYKLTASEEIAAIQAEAEELATIQAQAEKAKLADMKDNGKQNVAEVQFPTTRRQRIMRLSLAGADANVLTSVAKEVSTPNTEAKSNMARFRINTPKSPPKPPETLPHLPPPLPRNDTFRAPTPYAFLARSSSPPPAPVANGLSRSSRRYSVSTAHPAPSTNWQMPSLSQDSVLTYAPGELVRPVKAERSGWFEESEVVMGVRFLVG